MSPFLSVLGGQWPTWTWRSVTLGLLLVTALGLAVFTTRTFYVPVQTYIPPPVVHDPNVEYASPRASHLDRPDFCDAFDVSKIAITIKTGATESRNKIPTQLVTFLRCIPDVTLFSDLDQTLGSHKLENALSEFTKDSTQGLPDFDLYWKQKEYADQARDIEIESLGEIPIPYNDWRTAGKSAAWGLDKYKFLPMIKRTWDHQPDKEWYVFIEADTYLSISNLLRFVSTQNPKEKLYFGNGVRMWEHPTPLDFAHGGSGFILSGATVKAFAEAYDRIDAKFTAFRIAKWFYGDFVVADALDEEVHVHVTDAKPMINSDEPAVLPFEQGVWCKPVITLHHMDAKQFDDMYRFQRARNFSELLFRDVFAATYTSGLPLFGESWDNLSDDGRFALPIQPNDLSRVEGGDMNKDLRDPNTSYKACEAACDQNGHCFQFAFITRMKERDDGGFEAIQECHLSKVFRLGREFKAEEHKPGARRDSGWRTDRITRFVDEHQECPDVNFSAI